MPMKIPLKFPELPPATTATIGGALQRLAAVEEEARPHDDTEEGAAVLAVCAALRSCTLFAQKTESSARGLLSNARESIEVAADMAASNVVADGYPGPGLYNAAVERVRGEVAERYGADAWKRVLDQEQESASRHAAAADIAMRAAKKTVDAARARLAGPLALREKTSEGDLYTMGGIKTEEEAKTPTAWLETLESLIASGDEHAEALYTIAVRLLCQEVVSMQPSKLRERYGAAVFGAAGLSMSGADSSERRELLERERAAALKFLDRVKERAEEKIPDSLKFASAALLELRGVFIALLGYNAKTIPRDVFDRHRSMPGASPLDIEPSWPYRLGMSTSKAKR